MSCASTVAVRAAVARGLPAAGAFLGKRPAPSHAFALLPPSARPRRAPRQPSPPGSPGRLAREWEGRKGSATAHAAPAPAGEGGEHRAQQPAAAAPAAACAGTASSSIVPAPGLGGRSTSPPPPSRKQRQRLAARRAASTAAAAPPQPPPRPPAPTLATTAVAALARAAALARGWAARARAAGLTRWIPPWVMGLASAAVGALALAWRSAAPFPLRRAAWCVSGHGPAGPPHPALHASPRLAALRAAAARGDGPAAVAALGFPQDGRCAAPLADVPAYRLEALVGRRLSARARRRVLAALALPSSLDAGSILSRTPSSSAPCSPPSPDGGEGAPLLGHAPGTPAAAAAASARPHGAAYEFERLEFLGDAVLEVAAREWALARFPRASEHVLSNAARGLVCGRALLAVAASPRLRLDVYVAANAHAMADGRSYLTTWAGPGGVSSLVDAFEALVGALYLEFGLDAAAKWALAAIEEVLDPARLGLELNSKALLILTAADHTRISYKARQARGAAWDGHSSSHPVLSSARIGEAGAAGATSPFALPSTVADAVDADAGAGGRGGVATAGRPPRDGGPPPAPPLCWEVECYVDGRLAGHGVDVHRSTAEQAAAREALVGVFGVQADEVWRERVADQL